LYFTSTPGRGSSGEAAHAGVRIDRLALDGDRFLFEADRVTTVQPRTANANGMTLGHDRRLIVCEQQQATAAHAGRYAIEEHLPREWLTGDRPS
jgi:hypothetical protein